MSPALTLGVLFDDECVLVELISSPSRGKTLATPGVQTADRLYRSDEHEDKKVQKLDQSTSLTGRV